MKAVILYKPNTEKETSVLEYVREFARVTPFMVLKSQSSTISCSFQPLSSLKTTVNTFVRGWSEIAGRQFPN